MKHQLLRSLLAASTSKTTDSDSTLANNTMTNPLTTEDDASFNPAHYLQDMAHNAASSSTSSQNTTSFTMSSPPPSQVTKPNTYISLSTDQTPVYNAPNLTTTTPSAITINYKLMKTHFPTFDLYPFIEHLAQIPICTNINIPCNSNPDVTIFTPLPTMVQYYLNLYFTILHQSKQ